MLWTELEEQLVDSVFGDAGSRTRASGEIAAWVTGQRQQSMSPATMDLCDFAMGRLLHNRNTFPRQFQDRSSWWSGASLYHSAAQVGLIVKNRDSLALATFAWRLWCKAMELAPEPDLEFLPDQEDEHCWEGEPVAGFLEESFRDVPELQRLVGSDILRVRSQAYAVSMSAVSLWRGHNDLERALRLLGLPYPPRRPQDPPGGAGEAVNGLIWVPVPAGPGGLPLQSFVLSDPTPEAGPARLVFGQKVSLLRELALVDQQLAFLHLRASRWDAARRYFRESAGYWSKIRDFALQDAPEFIPKVGSELEPLLQMFAGESFISLEKRVESSDKPSKAISMFFSKLDWASDFREGVETLKTVLLLSDLRKVTLETVLGGTGMTPETFRRILTSLSESGIADELNVGEIIVAWSAPDPKSKLELLFVWMEDVRKRLHPHPPGPPQFRLEVQIRHVLGYIRDIAQESPAVYQESYAPRFLDANAYWAMSSFPGCRGLIEELLRLGGGPQPKANG